MYILIATKHCWEKVKAIKMERHSFFMHSEPQYNHDINAPQIHQQNKIKFQQDRNCQANSKLHLEIPKTYSIHNYEKQ